MKRLERPVRHAVAMALSLAAVCLAVIAPGVAAGDQIARPPGAIDQRGYELVSLPDKSDNPVQSLSLPWAGGDRAVYDVFGGAPGSPEGVDATYLATRTPSGWESQSYLPPSSQILRPNYVVGATTPDLSASIMSVFQTFSSDTTSPDELFVRLSAGQQTLLHTFPVYFGGNGASIAASDDLTHVLAAVPEAIDPSHQPGTTNVYDFGSGTPRLVSAMPGTNAAPVCGISFNPSDATVPPGFAIGGPATEHWVSADGARAFFLSRGDDPACAEPVELYARDLGAGTTTLLSTPLPGDPDNGVDRFLGATSDGSQVFFRTATSLDAADDADGDATDMDVYRTSIATGHSICLTCSAPNAGVSTFTTAPNAVVSEDGSHVYFTSPNRLADAPAAGSVDAPNLYVWRLHRSLPHFVARVNDLTNDLRFGGEITPDGSTLIFRSNQPGLDAVSGASNGGFFQLYRYDDRGDTVTCVSCPADGTATQDVFQSLVSDPHPTLGHDRAMSDDGRMLFFTSFDALVPGDVNDGPDVYEWHDGAVGLITSGTEAYPRNTAPFVMGVSPDGRDVFFFDNALLTFDARDRQRKLYDARVGGGFAPPAAPPPCEGEQCHGSPATPPSLPDPGSATLDDAGNVVPGSFAVARISSAQRLRLARTGALTLSVKVSGAGAVAAVARATIGTRVRTVARASRSVGAAGTVRLTLRLASAARGQLRRSGRLRLVLAVSFSNAPAPARLALSLAAPSKHGRRS